MKVWLVKVGETMPMLDSSDRPMRMSNLALELAKRGHEVTWWTSTMNHRTKTLWFPKDTTVSWVPNVEIRLLHARAYARNISISRYLNHLEVASRFAAQAILEPPPDIVVAALPSPEVAAAAVAFANSRRIPSVVDVRDLWPDEIHSQVPLWSRGLAKIATMPMEVAARRACSGATSIVGVSPSYVNWGVAKAGRQANERDRVFFLGAPPVLKSMERADNLSHSESRASSWARQIGIDPGKRIFLFVGTFVGSKDASTVVRAAATLHRTARLNWQIVIAGDGPNLPKVRDLARGLDKVLLVGRVDQEQLSYLLRTSYAGIAAYSRRSRVSIGNKLFEYLSGGLPVLSSSEGDARELIENEDVGLYWPAGSSGHLVKAMLMLMDTPSLYARQRINALQLYQHVGNKEKVYPAFADYLEQISTPTGPYPRRAS